MSDERADLVANAEIFCLAAALRGADTAQVVLSRLSAEDFAPTTTRPVVFSLIAAAARKGDYGHVAVIEEAVRQDCLADAGGSRALSDLGTDVLDVSQLNQRIRTVEEAGYRRRMISAGKRISEAAADFGTEWESLTELALHQMLDVNAGVEADVGILRLEDVEDKVDRLYREGAPPRGVRTGWSSVDQHYRPKPGRLTVLTGRPGSGKSSWMDALACNLARNHGWHIAFCSPEKLPVEEHVAELVQVFSGVPFYEGPSPRIGDSTYEDAKKAIRQHFSWTLPPENSRTPRAVLALASLLDRQTPLDGLVIDPWNQLEHERPRDVSETEYIGKALTEFRGWVRSTGAHLWVVAHPRKPSSRGEVPRPYDISGSSNWFNAADNCLTVWRDREEPRSPVQIHVQKIRHQPWEGTEGMVELSFVKKTKRYKELSSAF